MKSFAFLFAGWTCVVLTAQTGIYKDPFRQLDQQLPTPNDYRNASEDNFYPRQQQEPSRFELFKQQQQRPLGENEMQRAKRAAKT